MLYRLVFTATELRLRVIGETLESPQGGFLWRDTKEVRLRGNKLGKVGEIDPQQSLLSQVRDPVNYPHMAHVGDQLGDIRLFRGWPFGRGILLRKPQNVTLPDDFLLEDGSNLGLILNDFENRRATKRLLLERLRLVYEGIEEVTTKVQGGTIQIFFHEEGVNKPIPVARLSDGILHYLCLLTVLLHPDPPPLICIEEPELGLHPDVIPHVADLLLDASKRTQLIVTTHSETLVSRLSDVPESVVVCERDDRGTHLRRLEPEKLRAWLDKYMLGELWRMGEIGGNR
jgi:predicted ATPase